MRIRKRELYPEDDRYIDRVINDMVMLPILHVGESMDNLQYIYYYTFCNLLDSKNAVAPSYSRGKNEGALIFHLKLAYKWYLYEKFVVGGNRYKDELEVW